MRLSQKWVKKLLNLPGAELGCQTVDVILKNGTIIQYLMVLNCQDILGAVYFSEDDITDIVASEL